MLQKIKRILGIVLLVAFFITAIYITYIRITDKAPSLFGCSLLRVSTDSMEPELSVGEIVLVKKVDPSTLQKGDVITYKGEKGAYKDMYITHQISKDPYEADGTYYFTTRGIKDGAVDDPEIKDTQIRGKVIYRIPFVGTVYDFFTEWYGIAAFIILLLIAFGDEIVSLLKKLKKDASSSESEYENPADIKQSENIEIIREQEFEGIITNLEDPDL